MRYQFQSGGHPSSPFRHSSSGKPRDFGGLVINQIQQSEDLCKKFWYHELTDLLCTSPLTRTIQMVEHWILVELSKDGLSQETISLSRIGVSPILRHPG